MRYLISGGNGFIGSYIKDKLELNGNKVKTLGKSVNNDYSVDLSKNFLNISQDFDVILHLASIVHNPKHANKFDSLLIFNDIEISLNFIRCLDNVSYKKLIVFSSVSVYGLDFGNDINVTQKICPKTGYGFSKAISEKIFMQNIPKEKLLIMRLPLVNGPNPKGNIKKAINAINSGVMILFKGNLAVKSVLELNDLYAFLVNESARFIGIHQLKSYDIKFNDFISRLTKKRLFYLPLIILKMIIFVTKTIGFVNLRNSFQKISSDLTFINTTEIE